MAWASRKSKYGAVKAVIDDITFDSKKEARRYSELLLLVKAGEIEHLELQVQIELRGESGPLLTPTGRPMTYVADFVYRDAHTGHCVIEDTKGFKTPVYLLKKAILAAQGVHIRET